MSPTTETGNKVRVIDTGAPPERFARGWHCLGLIRDFDNGRPHQISMRSRPRADAVGVSTSTNYSTESQSDATYYGPSYMVDKLWSGGTAGAGEPNIYLINCHYPITATSFRLQYGVIVEKPTGMDDAAAEQVAAAVANGVAIGFEQDVEIWKNKSRIDNPLLCEEDSPVYQLRRWSEQFYVDVEDLQPEMVNRFEFEIDTERALQNWQAEVDANLAAGRSAIPAPRQAVSTSS